MGTVRPPVLLLLLQLLCLCCLHVWAAECGPGMFGDRCQLQCHCNGTCDVTGYCSGGCSRGYHGATCQQKNVALDKHTNSSSHHENLTSDKAVDGNTRQDNLYFCFHSAVRENSSWWSVDLGGVFPMNNIVIYYRRDTLVRFTGATIFTENATGSEVCCTTISDTNQYQNAVVQLDCNHTAQKLVFRQTDHCSGCDNATCKNCFLEPCEVQVLVCTDGTYGQNCNEQCGHCSDVASCHHETGSCLSGSCQPGYRGDRCDQECLSRTFGQNCTGQCGHCSDGANCHHETGSCLSGSCQPGYRGDRCDQECSKTSYGLNCSGTCGHCSNDAGCHPVNGSCLSRSCQPGYRENRCHQKCINGTYGQDCAKDCSHCSGGANCHHETGSCLSGSCQPGYGGDRCDQGVDTTEAPVQCPAGSPIPPSRCAYTEGLGVGVAIGLAVCLALNAVSLAVFCCVRRYQRGPGKKGSSTSQRGGDTTQGRDATVYYNVSSTPAAVEGGSPYESLDTATRTENVPSDYVSIGSQDK